MAIEGDEEGSAGPLQSEEQRLRRSRNDETVNVSKAKLYSMYGVILMLLGALAVTNGSDWSSFRGEVKAEKEVVSLDRMTEVERPPSLPVMNLRGRAAEGDFGEEERERQVQQLLADARAAVEKRRAENGEAGAEGSGNGDDAEALPPPPAEEQGVESEEEEKETTPPPPPLHLDLHLLPRNPNLRGTPRSPRLSRRPSVRQRRKGRGRMRRRRS